MTGQDTRVVYRGSVKNIRLVREPRKRRPGRFLFEFTDDYSVFDYGKMPDTIRGKGLIVAFSLTSPRRSYGTCKAHDERYFGLVLQEICLTAGQAGN